MSRDLPAGRPALIRPGSSRPLAGLIGLIFLLTVPACRDEGWDRETAALVDGRVIPKSMVNDVLAWGFYPALGRGGETLGPENLALILNRLIDEELILAEAERTGLRLSRKELEQAFEDLAPEQAADSAALRAVLPRQLLLDRMTRKLMAERRLLSADDWRVFWEQWPQKRPPRFRVRALLLPLTAAPPNLSLEGRLEDCAARLEREGRPLLLSEEMWLPGEKLSLGERQGLLSALARNSLAGPFPLRESWAVYEVLEIEPGPGLDEEFKAARAAFEARAEEQAFRQWLAERRKTADIRINPDFK